MDNVVIRDKEILIATYAMRVFMLAIQAVSEDWAQEDFEIAKRLLEKLETKHREANERRRGERAEDTD